MKPIAVLISDIHYSLNTLELADKATRMAIRKANELKVPLIVAGDLHDTKAHLRGECVNAIIETFRTADKKPFVLVGNHDKINEKSENNSLSFLTPYATLIANCLQYYSERLPNVVFIPYQHDLAALKMSLSEKETLLQRFKLTIMHQGIQGSDSGEYIQDKTAVSKEDVADLRVISGHYHKRQTIKTRPLPRCIGGSFAAIQEEHYIHSLGIGTWDYIGNPYTLNFGEANDPPKGFQILMEDGSLEFVPTNLRKHVVVNYDIPTNTTKRSSDPITAGGDVNDLVWVKITGTKEQLARFSKEEWLYFTETPKNSRIDLIPTDTKTKTPKEHQTLSSAGLIDNLIESLSNTSDERKERLKKLWKDLK